MTFQSKNMRSMNQIIFQTLNFRIYFLRSKSDCTPFCHRKSENSSSCLLESHFNLFIFYKQLNFMTFQSVLLWKYNKRFFEPPCICGSKSKQVQDKTLRKSASWYIYSFCSNSLLKCTLLQQVMLYKKTIHTETNKIFRIQSFMILINFF